MSRTVWVAIALAVPASVLAGCGAGQTMLGTEGEHLFQAYDAVSPPGQRVALRARLVGGDFLRGRANHAIRFYRDGRLCAVALTDEDGGAEASFTPTDAGDYVFTAEPAPSGFAGAPPGAAELIVACRPADAPLLIVDLDRTVVAGGFEQVLLGDPEAMPGSPAVMNRLAEKYSVVYLTHRPDYFGPKSRAWLRRHGYPKAPLLLSDVRGFLRGSEAFKGGMLQQLRESFRNIRIGIGDKISDARAYHDIGARAFLIVQPAELPTPEALRALADGIERRLPADVQVVESWAQIERAIFDGASFPRDAMLRRLRAMADTMPATAPSSSVPAAAQGVRP